MENEELRLWEPCCMNYNSLVLAGHPTFIFCFPLLVQLRISFLITPLLCTWGNLTLFKAPQNTHNWGMFLATFKSEHGTKTRAL